MYSDDDSNINVRYEQTVDYVVKILGAIVKIGKRYENKDSASVILIFYRQHTLMEVLQAARDYANVSNDKILQSLVTKTEENLKILTEHNKVDPEKNYAEFLRDVAFVSQLNFFRRISGQFILALVAIVRSFYYERVLIYIILLESCKPNEPSRTAIERTRKIAISVQEYYEVPRLFEQSTHGVSKISHFVPSERLPKFEAQKEDGSKVPFQRASQTRCY